MGYMRHHAIVVTSFNPEAIEAAANKARELGMLVLGPSDEVTNGYRSMVVCPDGSKEGWEESKHGDRSRASFREYLGELDYDDGRANLDWVEIAYGGDDDNAKIEFHAWMEPND